MDYQRSKLINNEIFKIAYSDRDGEKNINIMR